MSETALKLKARRKDSAQSGGVFCSLWDLAQRWGCEERTAAKRAKNLPKYYFGATAVRYKLEDVKAFEEQLRS
jgi:hypothetical protein